MIKNGAEYIATLRDGRAVYLDGGKIEDVTAHPAFARAVASMARLYDFQAAPGNCRPDDFDCGGGRSREPDLAAARELRGAGRAPPRHSKRGRELHCGFIGRAPDHVASCISGMYMGLDVFEAYDRDRARRSRTIIATRATTISISPT